MAIGAYPGSFDPPTVAHLAVAEAAVRQCGVDRLDLVLSEAALGKEASHAVRLADRVAVLRAVAADRPWLGVSVTRHRLLADIAEGYDLVVMGADKWAQVVDPVWYGGSDGARDAAVARLPAVAIAPRPELPWARDSPVRAAVPDAAVPEGVVVLDVHPDHAEVSSTAVRAGTHGWLLPEAAAFAAETGAWVDADRYARWLRTDAS